MYVQSVMFFVTMSKNLKHTTVSHIAKCSKKILHKSLEKVFMLCNNAGFTIKQIHADPEFAFMKEEFGTGEIEIEVVMHEKIIDPLGTDINLVAAQEHQSEVEHAIRMTKERNRCMWH